LQDLGKPHFDRISQAVGGFSHFKFDPVGETREKARVGFAGKLLPSVKTTAAVGADKHLPFGPLLHNRLLLLKKGRYSLVATGYKGIGTVYGGLQYSISKADNGGVDDQGDADGKGAEQRVKIYAFGAAKMSPYAVRDEPQGPEAPEGLTNADELAAISEHGLEDGVNGGLEALDGGVHGSVLLRNAVEALKGLGIGIY
jgi:hypothetical protein